MKVEFDIEAMVKSALGEIVNNKSTMSALVKELVVELGKAEFEAEVRDAMKKAIKEL